MQCLFSAGFVAKLSQPQGTEEEEKEGLFNLNTRFKALHNTL